MPLARAIRRPGVVRTAKIGPSIFVKRLKRLIGRHAIDDVFRPAALQAVNDLPGYALSQVGKRLLRDESRVRRDDHARVVIGGL
jgi:hypothetical protein